MVEPAPGSLPGGETDSHPVQPPLTATNGVVGNGASPDAPSPPSYLRPPWPEHRPGRADGPLLPPEWPRPLASSAFEDETDVTEALPATPLPADFRAVPGWTSADLAPALAPDPVDDPANWGPPLPPAPEPRRSVLELLWPWGIRGVVETVEVLALAMLMFLFVRSIGQNFVVDGGSMEPTFHNGEMLIVNKLVYRSFDISWVPGQAGRTEWRPFGQPQPGDVVVFRFPQDPKRDFIKRIIAVSGQTVEVHGGTLYIDGQARRESYLDRAPTYEYGPVKVPEGQYFVLGDNRNNSYDSHSWGMLGEAYMIGRAEIRYWPLDRAGRVDNDPSTALPRAGVSTSP